MGVSEDLYRNLCIEKWRFYRKVASMQQLKEKKLIAALEVAFIFVSLRLSHKVIN